MLKILVFILSIATTFAATVQLGPYNVDPDQISVSGLSSGGFMAAQIHVIESKTFMGVGVIAGGPYNCANGQLSTALGACMASPAMINENALISNAIDQANAGRIDPVESMSNSKVYLYAGTGDTTVKPGVVKAVQEFYEAFMPTSNIMTEYDIDSEHGFATVNQGGACDRQNPLQHFINRCNYDTAFGLLNHIYGGNLESAPLSNPAGSLLQFDQSEFINAINPSSIGMGTKGYIFVPDTCADGSRVCKLHVSFHGCKQGESYGTAGDTYVTETGYNQVGALNDIIILSPQASTIPVSNPNGCWDFWGYTNSDYAYHDGIQVSAVMEMVNRIKSGYLGSTSTDPTVVTTQTPEPGTSQTTKSTASPAGTTTLGTTKITAPPGDSTTLGSYNADANAVSVSGLSSGGFMAVQMHVAASGQIMGAGAVAGGPYYCAMNGLTTTYCMYYPNLIDVDTLQSKAETNEGDGTVDSLGNLQNDFVYLYSGSADTEVAPGVVEKAADFYAMNTNSINIKTEFSINSRNAFPTMNKGSPCGTRDDDNLNNCGFAGAYEILNHIYGGGLQMPDYSSEPQGQLLEFNQAEFASESDPKKISMSETGMVFVPPACASGNTACRVHVAFHSCKNGDDSIAEAFARDAGYNEVAALNDIIVLYPRTTQIMANPQDCWDWWGYTNRYYATINGEQIQAVLSMVDRLLS